MSDIEKYSDATFESIKHTNADGQEYWLARELQAVLEYTEWRNFCKIIDKAKVACKGAKNNVAEHFVDVNNHRPCQMVVYAFWMMSCFPAMPVTSSSRTATRAKR